MNTTNNIIGFITGQIYTEPIQRVINNKKYYSFDVKVYRKNDNYDLIEVLSSEEIIFNIGDYIRVVGFTYSYKEFNGFKYKLRVCLYSMGIVTVTKVSNRNFMITIGKVYKQPNLRVTPSGKIICDILLSVNNTGVQDEPCIIPCIAWNDTAEFAAKLNVNSNILVTGRLQSRPYVKVIGGVEHDMLARELSINSIEVIDD